MNKKRTVKRKSRPIVQGYLERVNSQILDRYKEQVTELIQGNHGVYVLYRRDKLYYIGLASNLKRRINQHLRDRHKGKWDHFSLYIIRKEDHIRELECLLLRIAAPAGNNIQGKLKGSKDLLPILKTEVRFKIREEFGCLFAEGGKKNTKPHKKKTHPVFFKADTCPLKGLLGRDKILRGEYKGKVWKAIVRPSGAIRMYGKSYQTPSGAAKAISNKAIDGWYFWRYRDQAGGWRKISELRKG